MEVRGEERAAAGELGEDVLGDGPGEAEAVEGRRAAEGFFVGGIVWGWLQTL